MTTPANSSVITASEVAMRLGASLYGEASVRLKRIMPLEEAGPEDLTFLAPNSKRNREDLFAAAVSSLAGAVLVQDYQKDISSTQIVVEHPLKALLHVVPLFYQAPKPEAGIHPTAVISSSASVSESATIAAYVVVGDGVTIEQDVVIHPHVVIYSGAKIGAGSLIHSQAVIREHVVVGKDCVIQCGVIVGGDGFGYLHQGEQGHFRIPHIGTVELGDHVDLGSNATVDRGTLGATRIFESAKIDNLVMVGHNCQIGSRSLLCGQVGLSGSCQIGQDVVLAGQVGLADHSKVGSQAKVAAKSGIFGEVKAEAQVGGYPAQAMPEWMRTVSLIRKLPALFRRVKELERKLKS